MTTFSDLSVYRFIILMLILRFTYDNEVECKWYDMMAYLLI